MDTYQNFNMLGYKRKKSQLLYRKKIFLNFKFYVARGDEILDEILRIKSCFWDEEHSLK